MDHLHTMANIMGRNKTNMNLTKKKLMLVK
jgi:hypothetical protein